MRSTWDWLLFARILAIGAISISIIFSASRSLALNQLVFWVFGLIIFYVISQLHYENWKNIAVPFYFATLLALALLFIIASPVRGSVRWVDFGIFRVQPSEIAKIASIFFLAGFYSQKAASDFKNALLALIILLPAIALVFAEPDIGNAMVIFAIWLGVSAVSGLKFKNLILLFTFFALIVVSFFEILSPYQKQRIETFLDPNRDPLGAGYNIIQSKIAIGSGQLFGKGLGKGSQSQLNFLPEAESDFIFASLAEQLGLFGASLLLIIYVSMILRINSIAQKSQKLGQLMLAGISSFFLTQFLINVGMNLSLLPVTGITLPLVSYGGSSLISSLFLLGVSFSISRFSTS